MPELSCIQTYEKTVGNNYKPTLDRFAIVLKKIGLWNDEINKAFDNFEWQVEDNGFVYSTGINLKHFETKLSNIKIRPLVMCFTTKIDNSFKDSWICCELLIATNDIQNFGQVKFYDDTYDFVKTLVFEMQRVFIQTGVYFTNEGQDGSDFDGIRCDDKTQLWQFDYALIPNSLINLYTILPSTHHLIKHEGFFEAWRIDIWNNGD
jgi:hypothetical protein